MGKLNIDSNNSGFNKVRSVGMPLKIMTGTFDFGEEYPEGGEDFDLTPYFPKGIIGVNIFPQNGYIFEYDKQDKKVKAYATTVGHSHSLDIEKDKTGIIQSKPAVEVNGGVDIEVTGVSFVVFGY